LGRKIGEVIDGSTIGVAGKVKITGGSDKAGFPMRADALGGGKNYVLLTKGVGFRTNEEGAKKRKLVRGNTITEETYQVNAKRVEEPAATK
jgi:small subunit ribosomal protein S6e